MLFLLPVTLLSMNVGQTCSQSSRYKMDISFITHPQPAKQPTKYPIIYVNNPVVKVSLHKRSAQTTLHDLLQDEESAIQVLSALAKRQKNRSQQKLPSATKTNVVTELLIPLQIVDVQHNLALFKSEHGERYYVRCEQCSTTKQHLVAGAKFSIAYCNFRQHLKNVHGLTDEQVLEEAPRRSSLGKKKRTREL